jgi:hypothetical protein
VSAYRRVLGTAGNVSYSDGARRKAGGGTSKKHCLVPPDFRPYAVDPGHPLIADLFLEWDKHPRPRGL